MASQLSIYQEALEHLGERPLASLTEDREPRRALDQAWDRTVLYCLEKGFWNFALRSVELEAEAAVDPAFGYAYCFAKPTDWIRTFTVSAGDTFHPIDDYLDENGYWNADSDPLYVRYVSSDTDFGLNYSAWPGSFSAYVAAALARRVCKRLTNSTDTYEILFKLESRHLADAQSKDAVNQGPQRMPAGSWTTSRSSGHDYSRWNRRFR